MKRRVLLKFCTTLIFSGPWVCYPGEAAPFSVVPVPASPGRQKCSFLSVAKLSEMKERGVILGETQTGWYEGQSVTGSHQFADSATSPASTIRDWVQRARAHPEYFLYWSSWHHCTAPLYKERMVFSANSLWIVPTSCPLWNLASNLTLLSVEQCRQRIRQAQQVGSQALSSELKPIRGALHGVRAKLSNSLPSLTVPCFHDIGYILAYLQTANMFVEQ